MDLTGQAHEDTHAAHGIRQNGLHRIHDVLRPIMRNRRFGVHRSGEHDRFGPIPEQIEEIRALLKRVRAMGQHDARHTRFGLFLGEIQGIEQIVE
ncbi:hypothetical protein WM016_03165 [Bifidobacterium mongoliense]